MLAMVVNDDAGCLIPRVDPSFIASKLGSYSGCVDHKKTVGASLLAMVVNDDAGCLMPRGVLSCIASVLAPTGFVSFTIFVVDT
ncbi:hypothetical protein K9857_28425 [Pseudomonas sp. REP124]|uniref:hypothetical protein n=1 Tax=Pseudomonas sp. REP124 TaxID=2875731 RepID=UPI001CCC043E|nr:hypothetical protein [Pseudomonas sp. REP124]MBZ9785479.1 hypothetical protein [Pseudomonas sp. REP124]